MAQDTTRLYGGIFRLKKKILTLKIELILLGFLALFVGFYPVMHERGILPGFLSFLPVDGAGYRVVISLLGILALFAGFRSGRER